MRASQWPTHFFHRITGRPRTPAVCDPASPIHRRVSGHFFNIFKKSDVIMDRWFLESLKSIKFSARRPICVKQYSNPWSGCPGVVIWSLRNEREVLWRSHFWMILWWKWRFSSIISDDSPVWDRVIWELFNHLLTCSIRIQDLEPRSHWDPHRHFCRS